MTLEFYINGEYADTIGVHYDDHFAVPRIGEYIRLDSDDFFDDCPYKNKGLMEVLATKIVHNITEETVEIYTKYRK